MNEVDRDELMRQGGAAVARFAIEGLLDIRSYYEVLEGHLASSREQRKELITRRLGSLSPAVREHLLSADSELLWEDYFPSELRASVLITTMSYVERCLQGICSETGALMRTKITQKQLHGPFLERAEVFLMDLCSLQSPPKSTWNEIRAIYEVRNLFVHAGGAPDDESRQKRILALSQGMPGVMVTEFGVDLEREFVDYVLDRVSHFFGELLAGITQAADRFQRFEQK